MLKEAGCTPATSAASIARAALHRRACQRRHRRCRRQQHLHRRGRGNLRPQFRYQGNRRGGNETRRRRTAGRTRGSRPMAAGPAAAPLEDRLGRTHFDKVSAGVSVRISGSGFCASPMASCPAHAPARSSATRWSRSCARCFEARAEDHVDASAEVEKWLAHAIAQVSNEATRITPATRLIEDLATGFARAGGTRGTYRRAPGTRYRDRGARRSAHRR